MRNRVSVVALSAACIAASAGLASSARAIDIGPASVYLWTGQDYGAGVGNVPNPLNKPGDAGPTTWTWNVANLPSQPLIDSAGRIYFMGRFSSSPQINSVAVANNFGIFTATNNTNIALSQSWATGQLDPTTGLPIVNNAGSTSGLGSSSYLRVSGTEMAFGVSVGNPTAGTGIAESSSATALQNNQQLYAGTYNAQSPVARIGAAISVLPSNNDWTAPATNTGLGNVHTTYQSLGQFADLSANGTQLIGGALDTVAASPNPATAATSSPAPGTTGNASFLGTVTPAGAYTVVARAGDLPFGAGGPQFKGSNNGVGGFFDKINANGQVAYDAAFLAGTTAAPAPGGVTSANAATMWIYSPGSGTRSAQNAQVYQAGNNLPVHTDPVTGLQTSNGTATWSGGASESQRSFSNAGFFWAGTATGGDTFTSPSGTPANLLTTNTQVTAISTFAGGLAPTFVMRQNDIAPGYSAASNVHLSSINISNMQINNSGRVSFPATLQGAGITPSKAAVYNTDSNFNPISTQTPGTFGNEQAVFAGTPGITGPTGLHAIARKGDICPGFGGNMTYDITVSQAGVGMMNNAGDVLFQAAACNLHVGDAIDAFGPNPQIETTALFGYSAALNTVNPMIWQGQQIQVTPGVFKYVVQFAVNATDDGNGSTMGLNDNGQFVAWVRLSDTYNGITTAATSTAYVVLQVPAPGTGALAFLGLGVMARRRRR